MTALESHVPAYKRQRPTHPKHVPSLCLPFTPQSNHITWLVLLTSHLDFMNTIKILFHNWNPDSPRQQRQQIFLCISFFFTQNISLNFPPWTLLYINARSCYSKNHKFRKFPIAPTLQTEEKCQTFLLNFFFA